MGVSMASGEVLRLAAGRLGACEASIVLSGLSGLALCSLMLYWYLPASAPEFLVIGNQVVYILGSALVLACANATRSYSNAIAMRQATARGKSCKDAACIGVALSMCVGRGMGAFLGMGLAALPGGPNITAGCVTGLAVITLTPLAAPDFLKELRST